MAVDKEEVPVILSKKSGRVDVSLENVRKTSKLAQKNILESFKAKGISVRDVAQITLESQQKYMPDLTIDLVEKTVRNMLKKDDVQDIVQMAMALDDFANKGLFPEPLNSKIVTDAGYFGLDELLVSAIYQLYGMVAVTNYGYIDKTKPLIIGDIDRRGKETSETTTFLDDVVGALAGGACGYWAHHAYLLDKMVKKQAKKAKKRAKKQAKKQARHQVG